MNIGQRKDSSRKSNPVSEAKAVLKAARLLRLHSISPRSSSISSIRRTNKKNEEECSSSRNRKIDEAASSRYRSSSSANKSVDSFPFSFTRIQDRNPHDVSNEINNVLRELKQIKQNIAKDIHVTKNMDNNLTTRIHSFMEACNLVLKDFDRGQPEHEIDYSASYEYKQQQNIDDGKKERQKTDMNLERASSLRNKFQTRERSLSTTSCGSSVRFDLSQNEFFD